MVLTANSIIVNHAFQNLVKFCSHFSDNVLIFQCNNLLQHPKVSSTELQSLNNLTVRHSTKNVFFPTSCAAMILKTVTQEIHNNIIAAVTSFCVRQTSKFDTIARHTLTFCALLKIWQETLHNTYKTEDWFSLS